MSVCIVDYGMGNLTSVLNAVNVTGVDVVISNNKNVIERASHLIIPGVGSFDHGMKNLHDLQLVEVLNYEVLVKKKPVLGICLGMHLFATIGFENKKCNGLNWISGEVRELIIDSDNEMLPHIGWNDVSIIKNTILVDKNYDDLLFYFLHSYQFIPDDDSLVIGICDYANNFVSILEKDNIYAVQFHPEKSHDLGIAMIENFIYKTV